MIQVLDVWFDSLRVATVKREGQKLALAYTDEGVKHGRPLSLSMPCAERPYVGAHVEWWLRSHLPDKPSLIRRWGSIAGSSDVLSLLSTPLGLDCVGATRFGAEGIDPDDVGGSLYEMGDQELTEELAWVLKGMPERFMSDLYCSLPGFHPKLALRKTGISGRWARPIGREPSTHILKPRFAHEKVTPVTEFLMLKTAAAVGLEVSHAWLESYGELFVLVVERYDRKQIGEHWVRLHQEDFGQALGMPPEKRAYSAGGPGVEEICALLEASTCDPENSLLQFVLGLLWAWLTADIDAHARNYAVLWKQDRAPTMAPLYDRNTSLSFKKQRVEDLSLAMPCQEKSNIGTLDSCLHSTFDWLSEAAGVKAEEMRQQAANVFSQAPDALSSAIKQLGSEHRQGIRKELRCLQTRFSSRCELFTKQL